MKTPREYYPKNAIMYTFEQESCPQCEGKLNVAYTSKAKGGADDGRSDGGRTSSQVLSQCRLCKVSGHL